MSRQFNGERTVFSTNDARKIEYPHAQEWSWTLTEHHIHQKVNSKWVKALNIKYKTLRRKHHDIGFGNNFLDLTQARKEKIDQLDFMKLF